MNGLQETPARLLRLLADYIGELAEKALRREREEMRQYAAGQNRQNLRRRVADMVIAHLRNGLSLDAAVDRVEREQDEFLREAILWNYHHRVRQLAAAKKRERNAIALRLAHRGWTNREISRQLGVSPATVSRIVKDAYRSSSKGSLALGVPTVGSAD